MRSRLSPRPRRSQDRTRTLGQSLVEFGLVMPILLLLFAGAADFGRIFYGYVALENAVKEGALYGARYPLCDDSSTLCPDPDNVRWRVQEEAKTVRNPDGTKLMPTAACVDSATGTARGDLRECIAGDTYVVSATYRLNLITPILGTIMGDGFTLTSQSTSRVHNQAFDPTAGLAVTKLIRASDARNAADITTKCVQPDPTGSAGYYRSPCIDETIPGSTTFVQASFRAGDTIRYKVIVRNNGGSNVTSITMSDSRGWPASCPAVPGNLAVNSTPWECLYTRTASVTGTADSEDFANTFTVDGFEILATTDGATVTVERPPADLRVLKFVSPYKEGADGDGSITGTATFGTDQALSVYRTSGNVSVWFKVIVINDGGRAATGVSISDTRGALPYGLNNTTAACDNAPTSLAVGARFECRYLETFSSNSIVVNTVIATGSNVTPDGNDNNSAAVTVDSCSGSNKVVPNLIGLTKATAQTAWTNAGFTGAITSWSGANADPIVAQNRQAHSCVAPTTTITISRANT